MNKFIDDVRVVFTDELGPPRTPGQLLSRLHLHGQPREVQRAAVAKWLESNEPADVMSMGLEIYGLVDSSSPDG